MDFETAMIHLEIAFQALIEAFKRASKGLGEESLTSFRFSILMARRAIEDILGR